MRTKTVNSCPSTATRVRRAKHHFHERHEVIKMTEIHARPEQVALQASGGGFQRIDPIGIGRPINLPLEVICADLRRKP